MTSIWDYNATPTSNTGNPPGGFGTGQNPSNVRVVIQDLMGEITEATHSTAAGGSADALTVTLTNVPASLTDGMEILVRAAAANATTTPTLNLNSLGAKTITKWGGKNLQPGDIYGNLHECLFRYYLASTRWELLNPAIALVSNQLSGLTLSNDGGSPNTVIDISAGQCADSTNAEMMVLGAFTKTTGAWASGTGNGGLDTGSVANSTWYHVFVIAGSGKSNDALISTSATSPTMPSGYTIKRRIGSIKTDGSAHIISFAQNGDRFDWALPISDINTTPGVTTAQTATLTVPTGVAVEAILSAGILDASATGHALYISSLAQTDNAAGGATTTQLNQNTNNTNFAGKRVMTNTSAQVRYRVNSATASVLINTEGWIDTRGRTS